MSIEIIDLTHRVGRIQIGIPGIVATEITEAEGVELLETLARILDYTLIDHVERRELLELATEIDSPPEYASVGQAVSAQEDAAAALATAVLQSLRADDPQEA